MRASPMNDFQPDGSLTHPSDGQNTQQRTDRKHGQRGRHGCALDYAVT